MAETDVAQHKGTESGVNSLSTEVSTVREPGPWP